MVAGPEVARLLNSFEDRYLPSGSENEFLHHSDHMSSQQLFVKNVRDLLAQFEEYGNPFEVEHSGLVTLVTKFQFDEVAKATVKNSFETGKKQFADFVTARLEMQSTDFWDPIKSNNFVIFKEKPPARVSKAAQKYKLLKNDCQLFSRLFIGCTNRSSNLDEFFEYENQPFPISISENGHIRLGTKSDILECLEDFYKGGELDETKFITSYIIEGAIIPHFLTTRGVKTFADYSTKVQSYVKNFTDKYSRVDIVWDVYKSESLKSGTREKRGKGRIQDVKLQMCMPKNWTNFLSVDQNKEELFKMLSASLLEHTYEQCLLLSTFGDEVLCSETYDMSRVSPCNHEESDTRVFVHALDAVLSGHKRITIRTVDSDVVVLAVAFFAKMKDIEELWIAFGTKNKFRSVYFAINMTSVALTIVVIFSDIFRFMLL